MSKYQISMSNRLGLRALLKYVHKNKFTEIVHYLMKMFFVDQRLASPGSAKYVRNN